MIKFHIQKFYPSLFQSIRKHVGIFDLENFLRYSYVTSIFFLEQISTLFSLKRVLFVIEQQSAGGSYVIHHSSGNKQLIISE